MADIKVEHEATLTREEVADWLTDLADAIRRLRASGKPVVAYAVGYGDDSYQLAAAASEVWLNPLGGVAVAVAVVGTDAGARRTQVVG